LSFTFTQPVIDHQPAPAESIVSAVNYDRSPSLVELSATPNTPIVPREFTSFAEAQSAYDLFLPGCNWGKPPTLKRFWYESEKHLTPGVDFVSWGFREHPHWVAANNGEILERTEANEEVAGSIVIRPAGIAPEALAALDRSAKIAVESEVDIGPQRGPASVMQIEAQVKATKLELEEMEPEVEACKLDWPRQTKFFKPHIIELLKPLAEAIASGVITSIETTDGQETITTTIDQPGEGTPSTDPTAAVPTVRLKYTDAEYAELRRLAEENHAIELQREENLYAEISMERAKQEDKVKALKAEEKGQLENLRFMKSEGPKYPKNPEIKASANGPDVAVTNQEGGSAVAASPGDAAAATSDLDVTDERYQRYCALPLLPIVKDIKGLGTNKLQTLVDQYPTVGKLLDLMKEKGLQWFKAIGKGFGEELGSRIENAVGDALKTVE